MYDHGSMLYFWSREVFIWAPVLVLAGLLFYLVVRVQRTNEHDQATADTPLDVLKRRYARGEITRDEFEEAEKKLTE